MGFVVLGPWGGLPLMAGLGSEGPVPFFVARAPSLRAGQCTCVLFARCPSESPRRQQSGLIQLRQYPKPRQDKGWQGECRWYRQASVSLASADLAQSLA